MMTSIIDDKGRITIPKEIRDSLKLNAGKEIDFIIVNDKLVIQRKLRTSEFLSISGALEEKYAVQAEGSIDMEKLM